MGCCLDTTLHHKKTDEIIKSAKSYILTTLFISIHMFDVHKHTIKTMCNNEQNEEALVIANTSVYFLDMNKT